MKCSKSTLLMELSLFFVMTFYTLNNSNILPDSIDALLLAGLVLGMGKIAVSMRVSPLSKKEFWMNLFLLLISALIVLRFTKSRDTRLMVVLLTMFPAMDQEPEKIVKTMFFAKLLTFVVAMLLGGYGHINTVALHGGMILLLYIVMRGEKLNGKDFFVLSAAFVGLVAYTRSGSAAMGIGIALLSLLLIRTRRGKAFYGSKALMCIFPLALLLNVFFVIGLQEEKVPWIGDSLPGYMNHAFFQIVQWLDDFTSHRLILAAASLQKFGVSVWGGNVDYSQIWSGVYFNLDSGMMWLIQGWGLVITSVFVVLSVMLMRYFIKTKRYSFVAAAVAIALWATQEDMLVSVGTNFLLIFTGKAVRYNIAGEM